MGARALTPSTYDGTSLTASPFVIAYFGADDKVMSGPQYEPVDVAMAGQFPTDPYQQPQAKSFPLRVRLADTNESTFTAARVVFDPDKGPVVLKAVDGDGVTRTLTVRCAQFMESGIGPHLWIARLIAATPIWQADTADTVSATATSSPTSIAITAGGAARTFPSVAFTPTAAKVAGTYWPYRRHIVVANRSTQPLIDTRGNGYMIEVAEASGWDIHDDIVNGRVRSDLNDVRFAIDGSDWDTTDRWLVIPENNTHTADGWLALDSGGTNYAVGQTFTPSVNHCISTVKLWCKKTGTGGGGTIQVDIFATAGGLPTGSSLATSATKAASTLGTGAWVTFTFATPWTAVASTVYAIVLSQSAGDASNYVSVGTYSSGGYAGGAPVTKATGSWALVGGSTDLVFCAGAFKVWINCPHRAGISATILGNMTAGTTTANVVPGGAARFPTVGSLNLLIGTEVLGYSAHGLSQFTGLTHGKRNTTAASHTTGTTIWWVEHEIVALFGFTAATAGPSSTATQPVIDLAASTNGKWVYNTVFATETSQRVGLMLSDQEQVNALAPYVSMVDTGTGLEFADTHAVAGAPARNYVDLKTPALVNPAAGGLTHDVTVPTNMLCNVYGFDADGNKSLLAQYDAVSGGTAKTVTPSSVLTRLRYEAMVRTITGAEPAAIADEAENLLDAYRAEQFTLDAATLLTGVSVKLTRDGSATGYIKAYIWQPTSGSGPEPGGGVVTNTMWGSATAITVSDIGNGSYTEHLITFPTPIMIPAGSNYYLALERTTAPGNVWWQHGLACYAKGSLWSKSGGSWVEHPEHEFWFRIFGDGSICQPEVPTGSGEYVQVDNITPVFAAASTPCALASAQETVYARNGVLAHPDTGQTVAIKAVTALNAVYTVDALNKAVTCTDLDFPLATATFSDETEMMHLNVGAQTPTWTDATIGGGSSEGIVVSYRKRWP